MRIWDLPAGYLNRQSLLGEHRELHGLRSILVNGKTGYSRHPETRRWVAALGALTLRHDQLAAEMRLRVYEDRTPISGRSTLARWPHVFVTEPAEQIALLRKKYVGREKGRITLPRNAQELWAQHKYLVMARSLPEYKRIGRAVAWTGVRAPLDPLMTELVMILREAPSGARNAVEHMWGYVRTDATTQEVTAARRGWPDMLRRTQIIAMRVREPYLLASTALSELEAFAPVPA